MRRKDFLLLLIVLIISQLAYPSELDSSERKIPKSVLPVSEEFYFSSPTFAHVAFYQKWYFFAGCENRFLTKELMDKQLAAVVNYKGNAFSLSLSHFGFSKYGELRVSAGYSKLFFHRLSVGAQFHYYLNHVLHYGNLHSFTFDVSLAFKINQKSCIGISVFNPAYLKYGITGEGAPRLPLLFQLNYFYSFNPNFLIYCNLEKELTSYFLATLGIYYRILPSLMVRGSFSFPEPSLQIGVKMDWRAVQLELLSKYHFKLGFSPQLLLTIPLSK